MLSLQVGTGRTGNHASFDDLTKRFGKRQLFRWALPYEYLLLEYLVGAPTVNPAAPTLQIRYHCAYAYRLVFIMGKIVE